MVAIDLEAAIATYMPHNTDRNTKQDENDV
jgi:hypothetical protein